MLSMRHPFCVLIPAHNEAAYIQPCLEALLAQEMDGGLWVVVAANGCRDDTVARAEALAPRFAAKGWTLQVLDLPDGGKPGALNAAEAALPAPDLPRAYLDADVLCDPGLIQEIARALDTDIPRYATGTLAVTRAQSWVTRAYAKIWQETPFVRGGAVGAGFFAVNGAGRARWETFPQIISDDTYVRLQFTPEERVETPALYHWPMVGGLSALIRVRARQDQGVRDIAELWPALMAHEGKASWARRDLIACALRHPLAMAVYLWVHFAVRLRPPSQDWTRGR